MNDHVNMYESVESVCVNDGSESGSNINLLELSRIKEGPGEETQGKERSSSESRMMDSARFNELTEKQANPNIVMIDYNEQVRANSTKSVKKPRIEELGEDEHDRDELNPWAATKSTGKDDNISTKYFHQSMKTKVIGDRDESGGSTKPTCSVHAPEMGSTLTTHGQGTGNMWEGGRALDPSVDRLGVPRTVVQSPPLWRGPRPPDQTSPGAKGRGQGAPGGTRSSPRSRARFWESIEPERQFCGTTKPSG